jgi:putative ABC transport system permease protein
MPSVVILQTLVALLVPVAAALVPVLRGSSITVQTALSGNLRRSAATQGWLEGLIMQARGRNGVRLLAFRNTFRNKRRLLITLLTLALGGAIFIAVFNVQGSLDQQIERVVGFASADVYLDMDREYPISEIVERLEAIPGVAEVEAWKTAMGKIALADGAEVAVYLFAPPDETRQVTPVTSQGRWVMERDAFALVVNDAFRYTFPNLQPGDSLRMEVRGKTYDWHVVGIYHYSGIDRKMAYTNFDTLSSVLHDTTHAVSFRIVTEKHDGAFQAAMAQSIDAQLGQQGYSIGSVTARYDILEEPVEKLNIVTQVLMILAILTGMVGSIGLSGTLGLNVMERTSEIGILRAVGAHNRIITRLVIMEGLIIGLISYLLGVLFSFPITRLLSNVVNMALFHDRGQFVVTGMGFSLWLVIVLMLSILASVIPARNAKQLTIREVLAYE